MQKDLFQIAQMSDIYSTLNLWAILSPGLSPKILEDNHRNSKNKTGKKASLRLSKKLKD
jgi:hypothetical protein